MSNAECPDVTQLRRFLAGESDPSYTESLAEHFATCADCVRVAETIEIHDPITLALAAASRYPGEPEREQAVVQMLLGQDTTSLRNATEDTLDGATSPPATADQELVFLSSPHDDAELGRLGNFRVLEVIGRGGMGLVFRAQDTTLKREIALKVMKPSAQADINQRERFLREAQAVASINHENVVPIHAIGEESGVPYIVMPLLSGEPLSERLARDGAIPVDQACRYIAQAAKGLAAAHQNGLLHRDIKPENLWIDDQNNLRLLDFGLARVVDDADGLTVAGTVVGTPRYMSPEQADGETLRPQSDLFSLGSVFYHLLAGHPPFNQTSMTAILKAIAHDAPEPISTAAPGTPIAVADIVHQLLEKRPEDRIQSAAVLAHALDPLVSHASASDMTQPAAEVADSASRIGRRQWFLRVAFGTMAAFLLMGLTLLRVNTSRGTLVIEIAENSGIEVQTRLQQGAVEIVDTDNDRTWNVRIADNAPENAQSSMATSQQLPAGRYQVRLPPGLVISDSSGVYLRSESFELRRGDELRLRVRLADPAQQPDATETVTVPIASNANAQSMPPQSDTPQILLETYGEPTGANRTALHFDGIDNYVDITSDWTWDGQDFTFEAWLTVPGLNLSEDRSQLTLLSMEHGTSERTGLRINSQWYGSVNQRIINTSTYQSSYHPFIRDEIPPGQLCHFAVSWKGLTTSYFINGRKQPIGESTYQAKLTKNIDHRHTFLAAFASPTNSSPMLFWQGLMHQVRLTEGALYDTDFMPEIELTALPETIALYKFDEGNGDVAHDASGNQRHGKIHGATWTDWEMQHPVLVQDGAALAQRATVQRPAQIPGLRSWSIEPAGIHEELVSEVIWHPSGQWFATFDTLGTLRIWGADGQLKHLIHAGVDTPTNAGGITLFNDGNFLATLSFRVDGALRVWDTSTWKCVREIKMPRDFSTRSIASTPNGRRLAVVGSDGVLLIDPLTKLGSRTFRQQHCNAISQSPDGKTLVVAREHDQSLHWMDADTSQTLHSVVLSTETKRPDRSGSYVAFSPDGRWVACATRDGLVQLFDAESAEQQAVFKTNALSCFKLDWFRDSRRFAVAEYGGKMVSVWDIQQPDAPLMQLGSGSTTALAISPDQSEILYHSRGTRELFSVNVASGLTRRVIKNYGLLADGVPAAVSRAGDRLVDLHRNVLTVWDSETGHPLKRIGGLPTGNLLAWSPDTRQVAISNRNQAEGKPTIVRLDSGETTQAASQPRTVWSTAWSPDGQQLAVGGKDQPIEIVDAQSGEVVRQFGNESRSAFSLVWSPNGESIAAWTSDRFVRVWDANSGTIRAETNQFEEKPGMYTDAQLLDWYPDNRRLCLALFTNITIFDTETGEQSPLEYFSSGSALLGTYAAWDGRSLLVFDGSRNYFWRGDSAEERRMLGPMGWNPSWHADNRRAIIHETAGIHTASSVGYDTASFEKLGTSLRHFPDGGWIVIGPEGHYRGGVLAAPDQTHGDGTSPEELAAIERHIVYTVLHEDGTRTLHTPAEFRDKFDWKNDPKQATLLKPLTP